MDEKSKRDAERLHKAASEIAVDAARRGERLNKQDFKNLLEKKLGERVNTKDMGSLRVLRAKE